MLTFQYASNPVWADFENTFIDLLVKWEEFPEPYPFSASPLDPEESGRAVFADAVLGEFGPVAAYQPNSVYYSTTLNSLYEGGVYSLGEALELPAGEPIPDNFTALVPPTPSTWQTLYWYEDAWVVSAFDPSLLLVNAQAILITSVNQNAAEQGNNEARIYSTAQLFAAADVDALLTADYPLVTLGDYQIFLDGQVTTLEATINAATTTEELYDFDPSVSGLYA